MGQPDVVLHIGAPKTGTSAIQRLCVSSAGALRDRGFYYPEHPLDINGVSGGHSQVAGALLHGKRDVAEQRFRDWLAEARERRCSLLLSAEAFYGQCDAMREMTEGLNVQVIAFLRHPIEYLIGNHNQGIKRHMSSQRFGDGVRRALGRPTHQLAGVPLLKWADAFGDSACCFLPYRSPDAGDRRVEHRFLECLGVDPSRWSEQAGSGDLTNRSYVKSALELKRLLNTVLPEVPREMAHRVDWCLQGYSDRAKTEAGYTVADIPAEVRERLNEDLLEQMQPVIERFPALREVAEPARPLQQAATEGWIDLSRPLAAVEQEIPDVLERVRTEAVRLRDEGRDDYTFCKLLDVLGMDFTEPGQAPDPLSEQGRRVIANEKSREPDYLREMALLLERLGRLEDAYLVIDRALEKRPNGGGIQKIRARIGEKIDLRKTRSPADTTVT